MDRDLLRDIGLVCVADGVVGASFGAIAVSGGQPAVGAGGHVVAGLRGWGAVRRVGVVLAGGSPIAATVAGLVLNARQVPFGFAVADVLSGRLPVRLLGTHVMVDESVAFAIAQEDGDLPRRRAAFWTSGLLLFMAWNLGVLVGVRAGRLIGDPAALGLDAASPAVLLALVLPSLRDPGTLRAAVLGGVIALAATPVLPPGVPVGLALVGLLVVVRGT